MSSLLTRSFFFFSAPNVYHYFAMVIVMALANTLANFGRGLSLACEENNLLTAIFELSVFNLPKFTITFTKPQ